VYWCTICGRHCFGHKHYQLSDYRNPVKELMKNKEGKEISGHPFEKDCSKSNGGGGLSEKAARFRRIREFAMELEDEVGKIDEDEVLKELIEENWNAPLQRKPQVKKILEKKEWNIPHSKFKKAVVENKKEENNAPNVLRPAANESDPELHPLEQIGTDTLFGDEDVSVVQFRHREENGKINKHENDRIAIENLKEYIEKSVKEFGDSRFGYCYMYPDCKARLYPSELRGLISKELYEKYKKAFNKKFKVMGGGSAMSLFTEASDAQCVVSRGRYKNTRKSKGSKKYKGSKTRRS
jgi:hypothetical protein